MRATTSLPILLALVVLAVPAVVRACITKTTLQTLTPAKYAAIYNRLTTEVKTNGGAGTGGGVRKGDYVGGVVRLAFHDAAEYSPTANDGIRGDGCLDLSLPDNGGLSEVIDYLNKIWKPFCNDISRGDFWYLAAKVAVEQSGPKRENVFPSGYEIPFKIGREDKESCAYAGGRLPSAEKGTEELKRVFVDALGLTLKESIALLGAHTFGRAEKRISGYDGAWVPNNNVFDNSFYKSLLFVPWAKKVEVLPTEVKTQWSGSGQIMLNGDMSCGFAIGADDGTISKIDKCEEVTDADRGKCPIGNLGDNPLQFSLLFARNNNEFLYTFAEAFQKMCEVGYTAGDLTCLPGVACRTTRRGPTAAPATQKAAGSASVVVDDSTDSASKTPSNTNLTTIVAGSIGGIALVALVVAVALVAKARKAARSQAVDIPLEFDSMN